jgi:hypothetical protein
MTSSVDDIQAYVQYLYDLQHTTLLRMNVVPGNISLRDVLDPQFLLIRPHLLKIMANVAKEHEMSTDSVYLAASVLDAYRANSMRGQSDEVKAESAKKLHVFAVGAFVLAASYIGDVAVYYTRSQSTKGEMQQIAWKGNYVPLSHYLESWRKHSGAEFAGKICYEKDCFGSNAVKEAQILVAAVIEWRMNRATANRFVEAFISQTELDTQLINDLSSEAKQADVIEWAKYFCETGVMNNMSCYYGDSLMAAAGILAARTVLSIKPVWPAQFKEKCCIDDVHDLQKCVGEFLRNHTNKFQGSRYNGISPAALSPAALSPAALFPAALSPAALSPAALSPAAFSPAALSLSPPDIASSATISETIASLSAASPSAQTACNSPLRLSAGSSGTYFSRSMSALDSPLWRS